MSVETWEPGMAERQCGGCTMCCKAPAIPEIAKPANIVVSELCNRPGLPDLRCPPAVLRRLLLPLEGYA